MSKYYQIDDQIAQTSTETILGQYQDSTAAVMRQYQDSPAIVQRQNWESTETVPRQYRDSTVTVLQQYWNGTATVPRQYRDSGPLSQHGLSAEGAKAKVVNMKEKYYGEYHHSLCNLSKCQQLFLSKQSIYF